MHAFPDTALVAVGSQPLRRLLCGHLRDIGIDDLTEVEAADHAILHLQHSLKAFQVIFCDHLGGRGHLDVLKFARWEAKPPLSRELPIICLSERWSGDQLVVARDAGVSAMFTLPLTRNALRKLIVSATSTVKRFIDAPTFHGFDRRVSTISAYKGPFRRGDEEKYRRVDGSPIIAPAIEMEPASRRVTATMPAAPRKAALEEIVPAPEQPVWGTKVVIGIPDMDSEHDQIRRLMERLSLAVSRAETFEKVHSKIDMLRQSVQQHFIREEMVMQSFKYDGIGVHKKCHDEFLSELERLGTKESGKLPEMLAIVTLGRQFNAHIANDDTLYVTAMLHGDFAKLENPETKQASIILHGAYELTAVIESLQTQLHAAHHDGPTARRLRKKLYEATERLANLLMLVPRGINESAMFGESLRAGFKTIRTFFFGAAIHLAEERTDKIISEAENVLKDHSAVPYGISAKLSIQWTAVKALLAIMGETEAMSDGLRLKFFRAGELFKRVAALEGERCKLIDYSGSDAGGNASAQANIGSSQAEVKAQLAKKALDRA
jgi:hemerythrin-like metal-binding protein